MTAATIGIFEVDEIPCAIKFVGTNSIGNPQTWVFPKCTIKPGKAISLLSDGWQDVELTADVLLDETVSPNVFGTITMADEGATSPAVSNYSIGKGILSVDLEAAGVASGWRDVGNASKIDFEIKITELDHFSSRAGIKTKDKTVITERSASLTFVLDELTADNLALAVMGNVT
jgi:hypothetical protein